MRNKKGNTTLIVIAGILAILVIVLMIIYFSLGKEKEENQVSNTSSLSSTKVENTYTTSNSNQTNNTESSNTTNTAKTTNNSKTSDKTSNVDKTKDDESGPEEVKKIDDSKEKIFEKEIAVSNGRTVKVPVINLTTKAATRINSEIEKKYQEEYQNGNYIVYYYYMYIGMISVILDHRYSSGEHLYELYNVNSETGKQMSNEDLLAKLKVSKEDFTAKAKKAYQAKFEEIFKTVSKNSAEYKKALELTLKNAEDAIISPMFINLEAQFACYGKIPNIGGNGESYELIEFN